MRSAREYADKLETTLRFGRDIAGFDFVDTMHNLIECAMSEAYEAGQHEMRSRSSMAINRFFSSGAGKLYNNAACKEILELPIKPYGEQT